MAYHFSASRVSGDENATVCFFEIEPSYVGWFLLNAGCCFSNK